MIFSPLSRRKLFPRWRSLSRTLASRELAAPEKNVGKEIKSLPTELKNRLENWHKEPSIITAAELVETAIIYAEEKEAINAARRLVKNKSATSLVQKQAALVLRRTGNEKDIPINIVVGQQDTAHLWRERTKLYPRNTLAWVELALAQVSKGHDKQALRSMQIALHLAPVNRHVIRSFARLFLHIGEPDRAYDLVRFNEATPHDPWLIAAEIALAPGAMRKPSLFKRGIQILEKENWAPHQITELAGSLGSMYLVDGNRKRGKYFFQQSMVEPTGNSLAQAEWASQSYNEPLVDKVKLQKSIDSNEALTLHYFRVEKSEDSLKFADQWIDEEPFSGRAYVVSSCIASAFDEYEKVLELTQNGLMHDKKSYALLHNRVYALACLGKTTEAEEELSRIPTDDPVQNLVGEANRGLIELRRGQLELGKMHYQKAISGFQQQRNILERVARGYYAREAARAGLAEAPQLLIEAEKSNTGREFVALNRAIETARATINLVKEMKHGPFLPSA